MKSFTNLFVFSFLFSSLKRFALARVKTKKTKHKTNGAKAHKNTKNNIDPYLNGKKIKLHFVHEQDICITAVHVYTRGKNTLLALHSCTVISFSFIINIVKCRSTFLFITSFKGMFGVYLSALVAAATQVENL